MTKVVSVRDVDAKALGAVLAGVAVITLDISLTSTAVPTIAFALGVEPASTIWIINIYYLSVIAALLPLAALGEIFGHRRVFLFGVGIFAIGCFAAGFSDTLWGLMAARALAGVGSAAVSATTPALIRTLYPPERLARGLGFYAMIVGLAFAIGPTVTSAVLSVASWPWLFLQSAPIALAVFVLGLFGLPATERQPRRFDFVSALLCSAMFACFLFAIAGVAHLRGAVLPALLGGAVFAWILRRREAGESAPILADDLFAAPIFSLSAATATCAFAVQGLMLVVLPFLFITKMGFTQIEAGLLISPWPTALALMTFIAAPLAERIAPAILGLTGLLILACALGLLATMSMHASIWDIGWRLLLCGIGFGFFQAPNMLALMGSAPRDRSGGAGGILATARLLGQSIGAAAVAFCLSAWPVGGVAASIWLGAALTLVGSAIGAIRLVPSVARPP